MATLDISSHGPSISRSYNDILKAAKTAGGAANSTTYSQWALYSVSTPLSNAFTRDNNHSDSVLKLQTTGAGDLSELIEEFSDGRVQFALAKVSDPNTELPKLVLISWCGEGVPERTKGYFNSHSATVARTFPGYHVQISARSEEDLSPDSILKRFSSTVNPNTLVKSTAQDAANIASPMKSDSARGSSSMRTSAAAESVDRNGWGVDAPPVTRSYIEKVAPAYQRTRIQDIPKAVHQQQQPLNKPQATEPTPPNDIVKGGYQPVGKVDIAALKKLGIHDKDDRPAPVSGAYIPVGKVDIAAIRARARGADSLTHESNSFGEQLATVKDDESTSPVKHQIRMSQVKPQVLADQIKSDSVETQQPLSTSKSIARPHASKALTSSIYKSSPSTSWKSSYTGKSWAPVKIGGVANSIEAPARFDHASDELHTSIPKGIISSPPVVTSDKERLSSTESPEPPKLIYSNKPNAGAGPVEKSPIPETLSRSRSESPEEPAHSASLPPQAIPSEAKGLHHPVNEASTGKRSVSPDGDLQKVYDLASADEDPKLEPDQDIKQEPEECTTSSQRCALVKFDYQKIEENELDLIEGETITSIDMVDDDWWLGNNSKGEAGLFPSNYVELLSTEAQENNKEEAKVPLSSGQDLSASVPSIQPSNVARALYEYEAAEDNELSFSEGARITNVVSCPIVMNCLSLVKESFSDHDTNCTISEQEFPDEDWWYGQLGNDSGLFPANHVELEKITD